MRSYRLLAVLLLLGATGQDSALPALTPYPPIAQMVAAVRADRLRATDETLVAFGTRNDFSETASTAQHGVFGARDWIVRRFTEIAGTTGGRMTVTLDTYLQPKTARTAARGHRVERHRDPSRRRARTYVRDG